MTKENQYNLFHTHVADLRTIVPGAPEIFICPICLTVFSSGSVEKELVDTGHVWPTAFRKRSNEAPHQQVLLCKNCNSKAGSAGDEIMQADLEIIEGDKEGALGLRKVQVLTRSREPLFLEVFIQKQGEKNAIISFPRYRNKNQDEYFREQQRKLFEYASEEPIDLVIYPPRAKPSQPFGNPNNGPLVQVGLLTSAYLLAFYQYGYAYILQTCLEPVRDYIQQSFERNVDKRLDFHEGKDICVGVGSDHVHPEPEIGLVISLDEQVPFYQGVQFLYYHVRLPVPSIPSQSSREKLILSFLDVDELPSEDGETLSSIAVGAFLSALDHPILDTIQTL